MRVLVVGAGASIEEARRANAPPEHWPPTMNNFAEKMWASPTNQFFVYWLPNYLNDNGITPTNDPTRQFIALSKDPLSGINVERLFEYSWNNRGKIFSDFGGDWANLIDHGILRPLTFLLSQAFFVNGSGIRQLEAGKMVASKLRNGDVVLNLNYDTIFEIALEQAHIKVVYSPNTFNGTGVIVAKPHGSLNLLANDHSFWFAQPDSIGAAPSSEDDFRNHVAIVPPRFNKTYVQQPIARRIIQEIQSAQPAYLTFWGVGLTDSDIDLIELYAGWLQTGPIVEVINPDVSVRDKVADVLKTSATHFHTIEQWIRA